MKKHLKKRLLLFPLLAGPVLTHAAALGELRVGSRLGQPFAASIELSGSELRDLETKCFEAVRNPTPGNEDFPWLAQLALRLDREAGTTWLRLTTRTPVNDPLLALAVRIGCGIELTRTYVAMLSPASGDTGTKAALAEIAPPPHSTQAAPPPGAENAPAATTDGNRRQEWIMGGDESISGLAATLYPGQPTQQKRFIRALLRANPEIEARYGREGFPPEGTVLLVPDLRTLGVRPPAPASPPQPTATTANGSSARAAAPTSDGASNAPRRTGPATGETTRSGERGPTGNDRLILSGPLAEPVSPPPVYRGEADVRERMARAQNEIQQLDGFLSRHLQAGTEPSRDPRILELQIRLASLQLAMAQMRATNAPAGQDAASGTDAATTDTPPLKLSWSLAAIPVAPAEARAQSSAPPRPESGERKAAANDTDLPEGNTGLVLFASLLAALGALLGTLAYRRRGQTAHRASVTSPIDATADTPHRAGRGVFSAIDPLPAAADTTLPGTGLPDAETTPSTPTARPDLPPLPYTPDASFREAGDHIEVIGDTSANTRPEDLTDLTDFLLATGRTQSAAELLRDYVDAEPTRAVTPWIRLLAAYQRLGEESEFRQAVQRLRLHFNIAEVDWRDDLEHSTGHAPATTGETLPRSIEEYPHVCDTLVALWGQPACRDYLEGLLRDNRSGQRQGFGLSAVQEILFLLDLALCKAEMERGERGAE